MIFRIITLLCCALFVHAQNDFRILGEKNGYDPQTLREYVNLTETRAFLDLAGEWTMSVEGVSRKVIVPSSYDYSGKVTFTRTFVPGEDFRNKHFRFVSLGINFRADIRINGEFVTNANNSYTRLEADLREDLIRIGQENKIEITVDSRVDPFTSYPRETSLLQPKLYSGITRELFLVGLPKVAIDQYTVGYTLSNDLRKCDFVVNWHLRNYEYSLRLVDTLRLINPNQPLRYILEMFEENNPEPVYTNRFKKYRNVWDIPKIREQNEEDTVSVFNFVDRQLRFSIEKPVFWNPITPSRYRVVMYLVQGTTVIDRVEYQLGIAQADVHDQYIFLNAQPVTIRAVEYYEDYPGAGTTMSWAMMEQDILKIKRLGANAVSFRHHPPHPYFVELCNRYGLLLFYEIPSWRLTADIMRSPSYVEDIRKYYRHIVEYEHLNPSILAWGVGFAPDPSDGAANYYFQQIVGEIKNKDRRPVFAVSAFGGYDSFMDNVDIVQLDIRLNNPLVSNLFVQRSLAKWPTRALIAVYGAQIFSNNQNGYSDPMSTKFQAKVLADFYKKTGEWKLAGGVVRSFNDFAVQRPYLYANPNASSTIYTSGVVTYDRQERYAFETLRALYSDDALEPIAVGAYEPVYPKTYPITGLILVVLFISFYRQSPKFKNSVHRSLFKVVSFFGDIRENRVITLWPALLVGFLASLAYAALLSIVFFELRRNHLFDEYLATFLRSNGLKAWVDGLAWSPELFVLEWTMIYALVITVIGLLFMIFQKPFQAYVNFQQSIIAAAWSSSHFLYLIPFVVVFHRLMKTDFVLSLGATAAVLFFFWHWIRFFRAAQILFNASWWRTGFILGGALIVLCTALGIYYSGSHDFFNVWNYIEQVSSSKNYTTE
ncbi:hypothetical protein L6Q79_00040 [bacterium]|nr:hypothetical protein [bacterium]NUN46076.1 hypothetical protein [bacterium]